MGGAGKKLALGLALVVGLLLVLLAAGGFLPPGHCARDVLVPWAWAGIWAGAWVLVF
jgi:hypothetical protein